MSGVVSNITNNENVVSNEVKRELKIENLNEVELTKVEKHYKYNISISSWSSSLRQTFCSWQEEVGFS
jgi:hypothetical protein